MSRTARALLAGAALILVPALPVSGDGGPGEGVRAELAAQEWRRAAYGSDPPGVRDPGRDTGARPPWAVPFVPQDELLCGAAALSMVYRARGVRDVQPDDWADLVRPEEGGIRTTDLHAAAGAGPDGRPWRTLLVEADFPAGLRTALARGPVIALVESAPGRYHYVVVVEAGPAGVRYHDPATGPDRTVSPAAFDRAWRAAGRWALLVLPPDDAALPGPGDPARAPDGDRGPVPAASAPSSAVREAGAHFRAGRWEEAARAAGDEAPRLRAASLYLAGRPDEALSSWAAAGDARLDLVRFEGLTRTRHVVAHESLGLRPGRTLRPGDLSRARRRLDALPSVAASRIEYRPVRGGRLVEVRASVVERPRLPRGRAAWAALGLAAAADGELRLDAGLTGAGERIGLGFAWRGARREIRVGLAAPAVAGLPGVVEVEGLRLRETHTGGPETVERVQLSASDWVGGRLRLAGRVAAERWNDGALRPAGGAAVTVRDPEDRVDVSADLAAGFGPERRYGRAALRVSARGGGGPDRGTAWSAKAWWSGTTAGAPRTLWPGAGTGSLREHLLRAHPLERDGVVDGPGLARSLAGGTVEVVHALPAPAALRLGVAAFLDGVLPGGDRRGAPGAPGALLDAGLGLRVGVPGLPGHLRVDAARGLLDTAAAVSAGWVRAWPGGG